MNAAKDAGKLKWKNHFLRESLKKRELGKFSNIRGGVIGFDSFSAMLQYIEHLHQHDLQNLYPTLKGTNRTKMLNKSGPKQILVELQQENFPRS